jgi:hypothetical protein
MDLDEIRRHFEAGRLSEAVVEPSASANGWVLLFKVDHDQMVPLTDHAGQPKVYHSLEAATKVARELGFQMVHVEEKF